MLQYENELQQNLLLHFKQIINSRIIRNLMYTDEEIRLMKFVQNGFFYENERNKSTM